MSRNKYALSYANQSDVKAGDIEGDYYAADLSTAVSGVTFGAGIEVWRQVSARL